MIAAAENADAGVVVVYVGAVGSVRKGKVVKLA